MTYSLYLVDMRTRRRSDDQVGIGCVFLLGLAVEVGLAVSASIGHTLVAALDSRTFRAPVLFISIRYGAFHVFALPHKRVEVVSDSQFRIPFCKINVIKIVTS